MARGPHPLAPRPQAQVTAPPVALQPAASLADAHPAAPPTVVQRALLAASRVLTALATRPPSSAPGYVEVMQAREADRDRWLGLTPPRVGA